MSERVTGRGVDVGDDIGDPLLERVLHLLAGWGVPALVTTAWVFLALTSEASGVGKLLMGVGLAIVLVLWWLIRLMMFTAAITRSIDIGNVGRAIELAENQLRRRRTAGPRARAHIYIALAHELSGDWAAVITELDAAKLDQLRRRGGTAWRAIAAAPRIAALVETGDAAAARVLYERELAHDAGRPGVGNAAANLAALADARIRWAEGELDTAHERFVPLSRDVRASNNARAVAHRYLARIATTRGDTSAADHHAAQAMLFAPDTWAATAT